jgi:hypothetical protein
VGIFSGPLGCETVQGAFCIVLLVRDHSAHPNDQFVQTFGSRPKITNTDGGGVEVRVEDGTEYFALRRSPGVVQAKADLYDMHIALLNLALLPDSQALDMIPDAVPLWGVAIGLQQLDWFPGVKSFLEALVIQL